MSDRRLAEIESNILFIAKMLRHLAPENSELRDELDSFYDMLGAQDGPEPEKETGDDYAY